MTTRPDHPPAPAPPRRRMVLLALTLALAVACGAASAAGAPRASRAARASSGASLYPAGATRPVLVARRSEYARSNAKSPRARAAARAHRKAKRRKPTLHGNPLRALLAFEAMQRTYYIQGSGLYAGEPFSYLWPFSQALAATVTLANVRHMPISFARELHARLVGLNQYLDTDNSGAAEGSFTSSLSAFDGTVAPPAGPGGVKFYDDNDWVGIELMRAYRLTRSATVLGAARAIMAFEMGGWQTNPELPCPGGIPFSNSVQNTDRNTITAAPAAELALQLYRATGEAQYLHFAEGAYQWVRSCLLQPSSLYADHTNAQGVIDPTLWSYGQGTMIGAGTLLYQATGNSYYLAQARQTAAAAVAYFTPERLLAEIPFFPSVYFRNILYLDSLTHDPSGVKLAQAYVDYAWQHQRLATNVFVAGSPAGAQLLVQAAIVQIYGLLSTPASTYF